MPSTWRRTRLLSRRWIPPPALSTSAREPAPVPWRSRAGFRRRKSSEPDLSDRMIEEARRKVPPELGDRVRFEVADASRLSYPDGSFDLVTLMNMIPFFDELARVTAPGGAALFSFSGGSGTPEYAPAERLRAELGRRGFTEFADFAAGNGTALVARKGRGT